MGPDMRKAIPVFSRTDCLLRRGAAGRVDRRSVDRSYRPTSGPGDMPLRAGHDGGSALHCAGTKKNVFSLWLEFIKFFFLSSRAYFSRASRESR